MPSSELFMQVNSCTMYHKITKEFTGTVQDNNKKDNNKIRYKMLQNYSQQNQ